MLDNTFCWTITTMFLYRGSNVKTANSKTNAKIPTGLNQGLREHFFINEKPEVKKLVSCPITQTGKMQQYVVLLRRHILNSAYGLVILRAEKGGPTRNTPQPRTRSVLGQIPNRWGVGGSR
jgi:hypothetical protein